VSAILSAEAALLHALSDGPGFGLDLIGRVRKRSDGRVQLSPGNTYPALERLRRQGLARSWTVGTGKGRPRCYYELTPSGIDRAASERKILAVFLEPRTARLTTARQRATMAARIEECEELSRIAGALRDQVLGRG
jgi:DNA-binding PadR family transcriptional regulator